MAKRTCEKCGRTKEDTAFYTYKNGEKTQLCKDCLLLHVNVWQPDTFLWLLQKMDVPYVPKEWDVLRDKAYAKNPQKLIRLRRKDTKYSDKDLDFNIEEYSNFDEFQID